jgi:hypothetical protein
MWDEQKRQRFQQLRQREGQRTATEQEELALLVEELEAAESAYLNEATQRLRQERQTTERQNRALQELVGRRQALVQRLTSVLAEARAERHAIESELASVLVGNPNGANPE